MRDQEFEDKIGHHSHLCGGQGTQDTKQALLKMKKGINHLKQVFHKKFFADEMEKNAYLRMLKPLEANDTYQSNLAKMTSHCSGELQKNLTELGQQKINNSLSAFSKAMVS